DGIRDFHVTGVQTCALPILPLFLWSLYATSIIQILATPVLAITLLLLAAERGLGVGIFDPQLGGDPVLYQHFFWFYSHPAVYIRSEERRVGREGRPRRAPHP